MAGVLEYALSLKTSEFDRPLKQSEGNLGKFDGSASKISSGFGGIAAAAAGAGGVIAAFAATTKLALGVLEGYAEFDGLQKGMASIEGSATGAQNRLEQLREVAKMPGLGFEEAVKGDIRLRSVGFSAQQSEKIMRSFGNAIATVGGGAADLDGVILALGQIQSKGKISTEEINQLAERVPQVRAAIKDAFGTADIDALAKSTLTAKEFVDGLTNSMGKLPQVQAGAQNTLDNYNDSWKQLKNSALEFGVGMATTWINNVSMAFGQARKDLQSLKDMFTGGDLAERDPAAIKREAAREAERVAYREKLDLDKAASEAEKKLLADNADFAKRLDDERKANKDQLRLDEEASNASSLERQKDLKKRYDAATLTEEAIIQNRLTEIKNEAVRDSYNLERTTDEKVRTEILGRITEQAELEKKLIGIQEQKAQVAQREADAADRAAEAAQRKADAVAEELAAQQFALKNFETEGEILEAIAGKHFRLAETLTRQASIEQLKLDLMAQQGLAEDAALLKAQERVALEERAAGIKQKGLLDEAASQAKRLNRQSDEDKGKGLGNTDRLAQVDADRRAERREAEETRRQTAREERQQRSRDLRPDNAADRLDPKKGNNSKPGDVAKKKADEEKATREKGKEEDNTLLGEVRQIRTKIQSITSS